MSARKGWKGAIENQQKGNANRKTHGLSGTQEYGIWLGIFRRCYNPKNAKYPRYGGRGIRVCERWHKFENFWKDMGTRPSPQHSIHRIDNFSDYEPGNCKWATQEEQQNNKRSNRLITFNGETLTLSQWARRRGMKADTLRLRLNAGWSIKQTFLTPVSNGRRPDPWNTMPVRKGHCRIVDGKNLTQWARETGMPLTMIRRRLALGWSLERTVTEPQRRKRLIDGKTVAQLARQLDMPYSTIDKRLALGWSDERILTEARRAPAVERKPPVPATSPTADRRTGA